MDEFPFDKITILVVNEHEAADLYRELGGTESDLEGLGLATALFKHFDSMQGLVVTLGGDGVVAKFRHNGKLRDFKVPSIKVNVKDTTAAGDTFVVSWCKKRNERMLIPLCRATFYQPLSMLNRKTFLSGYNILWNKPILLPLLAYNVKDRWSLCPLWKKSSITGTPLRRRISIVDLICT
jgi:hypothetical protein